MAYQEYKKKYSVIEYYKALLLLYDAIGSLRKNKSSHLIDKDFIERIMLRVTEVNGCAICSYAHTSMALKQGFSQEEIDSFLGGEDTFVEPEEAKALLFAQHYAHTKGYVEKEAYQSIIDEYGEEKSAIILAAIKVMMVGNISGIPISALSSRIMGNPYRESTLLYELGMILSSIIIIPLSMIHALFYKTNIRFSD